MKHRIVHFSFLIVILLGMSSYSFLNPGAGFRGCFNGALTIVVPQEFNVYLGDQLIYGQKVEHGKLRDATKLYVRDLDGREYTVWSYKLSMMFRGTGDFYEATHVDADISAREREIMQGLKAGDFIQITGIEVVNPSPSGANLKVQDMHCYLQ